MRNLELAPVLDTERLRRLSPLMGFDALSLWFAQLKSKENQNSRVKTFSLDSPYDRTAKFRQGLYTRSRSSTASLTVFETSTPLDSVNLRGRKQSIGDHTGLAALEEVDLVSDNELAWRVNSPVDIDLIPKNQRFAWNYEPAIIKVRSSTPIESSDAERRVFEALDVMERTSFTR